MEMELIEDINVRNWRAKQERKSVKSAWRVCLLFGCPFALLSATGLRFFFDESLPVCIAALLSPLGLALLLLSMMPLMKLYSNRWTITETKLILRGSICGSISWGKIKSVSTKAVDGFDGYYELRANAGPREGYSLMVSERSLPADRARAIIEPLLGSCN